MRGSNHCQELAFYDALTKPEHILVYLIMTAWFMYGLKDDIKYEQFSDSVQKPVKVKELTIALLAGAAIMGLTLKINNMFRNR